MLLRTLLFCSLLTVLLPATATAAPADFNEAKLDARRHVYHDRDRVGDSYCGCPWEWTGRSGGRTELAACGYQVRAQAPRAERIEWEHIVPASEFGRQRQCWQDGGRRHCTATDGVFARMEADLHNLTPVVGEVNGDRGNFRFGMVEGAPHQYGACPFKVDFRNRVAEPPDHFKGMAARTYFYMADRYSLNLSRNQARLLMAWDRQFPVSDWERERDRRIAQRMGHHNPFVTGQRRWTDSGAEDHPNPPVLTPLPTLTVTVHGNRNSRVYHLPHCSGFDRMAERNRVLFRSPEEAEQAGYRLAGNCRP